MMRNPKTESRSPRGAIKSQPCIALATTLALALSLFTGCSTSPPQTLVSAGQAEYRTFDPVVKNIEGFTVYIDPKLLDKENAEEDAAAIEMLANHLQRINILVPEARLKQLQQVGIWIDLDHFDDVEPGPYHPSKQWLIANGYDGRLAKKVHITRAASLLERGQMLKHPMVVLHELAHAYHDQFLGFDDERVLAAYKNAMDQGLYQKVLTHDGKVVQAYATTNEKEYFAEATESYFYRNDFFPFLGAELKQYDPVGYDLMVEIWGPLK